MVSLIHIAHYRYKPLSFVWVCFHLHKIEKIKKTKQNKREQIIRICVCACAQKLVAVCKRVCVRNCIVLILLWSSTTSTFTINNNTPLPSCPFAYRQQYIFGIYMCYYIYLLYLFCFCSVVFISIVYVLYFAPFRQFKRILKRTG